jgi:hypothetical protein
MISVTLFRTEPGSLRREMGFVHLVDDDMGRVKVSQCVPPSVLSPKEAGGMVWAVSRGAYLGRIGRYEWRRDAPTATETGVRLQSGIAVKASRVVAELLGDPVPRGTGHQPSFCTWSPCPDSPS